MRNDVVMFGGGAGMVFFLANHMDFRVRHRNPLMALFFSQVIWGGWGF